MNRKANLVIDQGNTRIKWAVFLEKELINVVHTNDFKLPPPLAEYQFDAVVYSSVGTKEEDWTSHFPNSYTLDFSNATPLMIELDYETTETLGADRIANACGAFCLKPNENSLIIDVGSCITIDLITSSGVYKGGSISPGLNMRYKSLNTFTANLPLVHPTAPSMMGRSTEESINTGVLRGMILELNGWLEYYESQYERLCVWLTGGDAHHFANAFKSSIFADSNLTLVGLHEVLLYNRK